MAVLLCPAEILVTGVTWALVTWDGWRLPWQQWWMFSRKEEDFFVVSVYFRHQSWRDGRCYYHDGNMVWSCCHDNNGIIKKMKLASFIKLRLKSWWHYWWCQAVVGLPWQVWWVLSSEVEFWYFIKLGENTSGTIMMKPGCGWVAMMPWQQLWKLTMVK